MQLAVMPAVTMKGPADRRGPFSLWRAGGPVASSLGPRRAPRGLGRGALGQALAAGRAVARPGLRGAAIRLLATPAVAVENSFQFDSLAGRVTAVLALRLKCSLEN